MSKKYLYYFSEGNDAFGGDKVTMKNTLGGKGAGLAEMTAAGMPVPQGFTITTDACTQYYADGRQINDEITADIFEHLKGLEEITGKKFGDNQNPLLVSVRSGARQSMPGMMDTILNLGRPAPSWPRWRALPRQNSSDLHKKYQTNSVFCTVETDGFSGIII